jgi:hypothetical protein
MKARRSVFTVKAGRMRLRESRVRLDEPGKGGALGGGQIERPARHGSLPLVAVEDEPGPAALRLHGLDPGLALGAHANGEPGPAQLLSGRVEVGGRERAAGRRRGLGALEDRMAGQRPDGIGLARELQLDLPRADFARLRLPPWRAPLPDPLLLSASLSDPMRRIRSPFPG